MKKRNIILIHFLYWFYILNQFLFPIYVGKYSEEQIMNSQYVRELMISLSLNFLTFYAFYFSFPGIVALKNKFSGFLLVMVMMCAVVGMRIIVDWTYWNNIAEISEDEIVFEWIWVWNEMRLVVITSIYAILIHYLILALDNQKLKHELINWKQAGELAILKSQVNPHFLFNTLNNIYSLVYHKSDEAPEAVMKFSSVMRYVLYETNTDKVSLLKKIEYLKSFIELQKLRFKQPGMVVLDIDGDASGFNIAPMLLIPFIENAFKFCKTNIQGAISIHLRVDKHKMQFSVCNYIDHNRLPEKYHAGGIEVSNVRRRLQMIYKNKHSLDIKKEDDQYKVYLLIEQ